MIEAHTHNLEEDDKFGRITLVFLGVGAFTFDLRKRKGLYVSKWDGEYEVKDGKIKDFSCKGSFQSDRKFIAYSYPNAG